MLAGDRVSGTDADRHEDISHNGSSGFGDNADSATADLSPCPINAQIAAPLFPNCFYPIPARQPYWHLKILLVAAIIRHLAHIFFQGLQINHSVVAFGVIVTAEPRGDEPRLTDFVMHELVTV